MQVKNSFDKETQKKLLKSFGYAFLSGVSVALTTYTQTKDVQISIISGLSALISFIVNVPIEYRKGEERNE